MSSMAAERTSAPAGRDNIFTRKIGPMPMWAWLAIILTAILGWAYFKNRNTSQSPSSTANASQVPQFVNQTFTNVGPPVAPTDKDTDKDTGEDKDKTGKKKKTGGGDDGGSDNDHQHHPKRPRDRRHPTHHKGGSPGVAGSVGAGQTGSVSTTGAGQSYPGARIPTGPTGPAQRYP